MSKSNEQILLDCSGRAPSGLCSSKHVATAAQEMVAHQEGPTTILLAATEAPSNLLSGLCS